jgi:ribonuclease-3
MEEAGVEHLSARLDYRFRDEGLLRLALTHKSYCNEHPGEAPADNERLEFLGDAVLDFVVSDLIMERYPDHAEGELSKIRASLVRETGLAKIARDLGLGHLLRIGKGEAKSGGREKNSILADALEALLAAIYLDSRAEAGLAEITAVIRALFSERVAQAEQSLRYADHKTELQEMVQKRYKDTVTYEIIREAGPDHEKHFEVAVSFHETVFGRGTGRSKKEAEQAAAREALEAFRNEGQEIGS